MTGLERIASMLDGEVRNGRTVEVWWRDDDAVAATPALDRLLGLAETTRFPLRLAVIPARLEGSLVERLDGAPSFVTVAQHGYAHANHARPGEKKAELGPDRSTEVIGAELATGRAILERRFGPRFRPMLVPPWNRIGEEFANALPELGYPVLSTFADGTPDVPGLAAIDTHIDPVDWRGGRSLLPQERMADAFARAMQRQDRPVGILTHHLMMDETTWTFVETLIRLLADSGGARPIEAGPSAPAPASSAPSGH